MSYEFRGFIVSDSMHEALLRYVNQRVPVGSFLEAVISNDLKEAVARADDNNLPNLPAFVSFLYNEAPAHCWGSPEAYEAWLAGPPPSLDDVRAALREDVPTPTQTEQPQ